MNDYLAVLRGDSDGSLAPRKCVSISRGRQENRADYSRQHIQMLFLQVVLF